MTARGFGRKRLRFWWEDLAASLPPATYLLWEYTELPVLSSSALPATLLRGYTVAAVNRPNTKRRDWLGLNGQGHSTYFSSSSAFLPAMDTRRLYYSSGTRRVKNPSIVVGDKAQSARIPKSNSCCSCSFAWLKLILWIDFSL
jgi:hypothetical protein